MNKKHRVILADLQWICNSIGGKLDRTSTSEEKLWDRQKAHMLVSDVLYGVLCDYPNNEDRIDDLKSAEKALKQLKELVKKVYPDRIGNSQPSITTP